MKVTLKTIEGHRALTYTYTPMPGVQCRFHLLSEVGEPWQPEAQRLTDDLCASGSMVVKQVELSAAPWYIDALVPNQPTAMSRWPPYRIIIAATYLAAFFIVCMDIFYWRTN